MAGKVEFDGDQFLFYKDQSTCTGGPEVVRQPTQSANSGECDGECIFTVPLNVTSVILTAK